MTHDHHDHKDHTHHGHAHDDHAHDDHDAQGRNDGGHGHRTYHSHDYLGTGHDDNMRRTSWVVWLTAAMMVVEIAAGYWTGSMALLADGFHMATHAGALGVAVLAYRYAKTHVTNPRFTFGTGKVGDLAGFASAVALALFALGIAYESVTRLINPIRVDFGDATLVAVVGLVVNIASALLLIGGGHSHQGHDHGHDHKHGADNNMRAAIAHVLADALTSVLAIVALLAGRYWGWIWLDPLIGLLGAIVIVRWSGLLLKDTAAILLDTAEPQLAAEIRHTVETPGDATVTDLHVWRIGPSAHAAIVDYRGSATCEAVRARLAALPHLKHITVSPHG